MSKIKVRIKVPSADPTFDVLVYEMNWGTDLSKLKIKALCGRHVIRKAI